MAAAFETLWFERCRAVMLEAAGALALVSRLCGDTDTVNAVLEGDEAARHQVRDAFRHLGTVCDRFGEIGPSPQRLASIAGVASRALAVFSEASRDFDASVERGVDVGTMQRVNRRIHEGDALLGELRDAPELTQLPDAG
jgi:hypothetical protein